MLKEIITEHKGKIGILYSILTTQYILAALIPHAFGKAIDGLINQQYQPFIIFLIMEAATLTLGYTLKRYDTKIYMKIFADKANKAINILRIKEATPAKIIERYRMVTSYNDYLEYAMPQMINASISAITALVILYTTDYKIGIAALTAYTMMLINNHIQSYKNQKTEIAIQKEKETIAKGIMASEEVSDQIKELSSNYVRKSNIDALNFFVTDGLSIGLKIATIFILISCSHTIGVITSTVMYIERLCGTAYNVYYYFMFVRGMENTNQFINEHQD